MTVIVGIRCSDGVVIGTDSAMTFGPSPQYPTIEQRNREKIHIVDNKIIVAGTGHIGLGQRFIENIEGLWEAKAFKEETAIGIGRKIAVRAVEDFASTKVNSGEYGALVAVPNRHSAELIEFQPYNLQPEVKTAVNWYASMGIAQPVADPLLGFVRTTFWGDEAPNRQDGVFAATLVLKLACRMSPTGVSEPLQMAILYPEKGAQLKASLLTEEELLEHEQGVDEAIEHFRKYRSKMSGEDVPLKGPPAAPSTQK